MTPELWLKHPQGWAGCLVRCVGYSLAADYAPDMTSSNEERKFTVSYCGSRFLLDEASADVLSGLLTGGFLGRG
jgi:hypothetical protein